jgi:hypothetical protein
MNQSNHSTNSNHLYGIKAKLNPFFRCPPSLVLVAHFHTARPGEIDLYDFHGAAQIDSSQHVLLIGSLVQSITRPHVWLRHLWLCSTQRRGVGDCATLSDGPAT